MSENCSHKLRWASGESIEAMVALSFADGLPIEFFLII